MMHTVGVCSINMFAPLTLPGHLCETVIVEWVYQEFGRRLRDARTGRELSQAYVADHVGLSRTSITNIERGRQRISLHLAYLLAEAVRAEPGELLPNSSNDGVVLDRDLHGFDEPVREWVTRVVEDEGKKTEGGKRDGKTRGSRTAHPKRA
jgi:transcriptional regulator with XRE-family HTH domain